MTKKSTWGSCRYCSYKYRYLFLNCTPYQANPNTPYVFIYSKNKRINSFVLVVGVDMSGDGGLDVIRSFGTNTPTCFKSGTPQKTNQRKLSLAIMYTMIRVVPYVHMPLNRWMTVDDRKNRIGVEIIYSFILDRFVHIWINPVLRTTNVFSFWEAF